MSGRHRRAVLRVDRLRPRASITTRHWRCLAPQTEVPFAEMERLVERLPADVDRAHTVLAKDFQESVSLAITGGLRNRVTRLNLGIDSRA